MRKLFIFLFLLIATPAFSATQWYQGTGTAPLQGTTLINDIDTASQNFAFDPLNRLMTNYRQGQVLQYSSASALTVTSGEIVVTDAGGTIKLMLQNTSNTAVAWTDIDTGAEAPSTTYYVYAIAASSSATTATYKISLSASAPSGVTYYKRIGSFYNNADSNIGYVSNDNDVKKIGSYSSKTVGSTYQATTDGIVTAWVVAAVDSSIEIFGKTDASSTPTTTIVASSCNTDNGGSKQYDSRYGGVTFPVKSGDYYTVTTSAYTGSVSSSGMYFTPIN